MDVSNPACGDILRLSAAFAAGRVAEVRYKVRGCTASIAAGSALTEWMQGKTPAELKTVTTEQIDEAVGGFNPRIKARSSIMRGRRQETAGEPATRNRLSKCRLMNYPIG